MTHADIGSRVVTIVSEQLGVDKDLVTNDSSFEGDLGADEFDKAELISLFESEFRISIAEYQIDDLTTVGRVVDFVAEHSGASL